MLIPDLFATFASRTCQSSALAFGEYGYLGVLFL